MYKVAPLLREYPINHSRIMYNIKPIQTVGETSNMPENAAALQGKSFWVIMTSFESLWHHFDNYYVKSQFLLLKSRLDELFARLDQLQSKVNTIKSVLAKAPKTLPKTNLGPAFVEKNCPLDVVLTFNPDTTQPLGLVKLQQMLAKRYKVATKVHVHSTATGKKCDLFAPSQNTGSRQDAQVRDFLYS